MNVALIKHEACGDHWLGYFPPAIAFRLCRSVCKRGEDCGLLFLY
jgi:hypothetical protein